MLLLHAFPLDGEMWGDLPGRRLDYPGAGSLAEWADAAAVAIEGRDVVVGLSMGGYAAFELVHRHPERVSGLVLADTRPGADSDEARAARDANAELVRREGPTALFERLAPALLRREPDPALRERARAICEHQPRPRMVAMLEALRDRADRSDALERIAVPTAVVCGAEDALTPPAEMRALAARVAGARFVEIAGAGHLSALEQPAAFAAACAAVSAG